MKFDLHTLIMLVGPSGSGKSYFSENILIPKLKHELSSAGISPNVQYLSSDNIRREVLGNDSIHKHDSRMMQASKSAFQLLHTKIDIAMNHPTLAHFIVVDTTGLSKHFRDQLLTQAKENNYKAACVIFDYKKNDEYMKYCENDPLFKGHIVRKHVDRLRKVFYKEFNRKAFNKVYKIKSKDFETENIEITNLDFYSQCLLPNDYIYDIVGDVHGCFSEFKILIAKLGYTIEDNKITGHLKDEKRKLILVGDLIDKGPESKAVIDFVLENIEYITVVRGNHENFVTKWLSGSLKDIDMTDDFRKEYFDMSFSDDSTFKTRLQILNALSVPFAKGDNFIVTHGPARNKFLEKLDRVAIKEQLKGKPGRGDINQDDREEMSKFYEYLKEEKERSYPWHVFGHVPMSNRLQMGNKLGIDTGCVHGGSLTAVTFFGSKPYFTSVKSTETYQNKPMHNIFVDPEKKYDFDLDNLEPRERGRIMWAADEKVNYISGTMAPAASNIDTNEIEPLENAINYFKDKGVTELVLQPKYMGSRCNMYIHRDLDKCYATTRKGYKIKHVDLTEVFKQCQDNIFGSTTEFDGYDMVIQDGELLPWHALGQGLIDHDFKAVEIGIETEIDLLEKFGFEDSLEKLYTSPNFINYRVEQVKGSKKDMIAKYGHHNVSTFNSLLGYHDHSLAEHKRCLNVYKKQLELFAQPGELDFKPFNILKAIDSKGVERFYDDNFEIFNSINEDKCVLISNLDDPKELQKAKEFFNEIVQDKEMEGVVVKPRYKTPGVAPFMKVRSENYLTIVYGYDYLFPEKYSRLVKNKRVSSKLRTSITEYEIGERLLSIKQDDIVKENVEYQKLVANMIAEEKKEERFDPRL